MGTDRNGDGQSGDLNRPDIGDPTAPLNTRGGESRELLYRILRILI